MGLKVVDPTQQAEGEAAQWANEPLAERHADLLSHTDRPFNAEPPNSALREMITPKTLHYRRQHTPVPVITEKSYRLQIGLEGEENKVLSLDDIRGKYPEQEIAVTLMCTGNRRSEFNKDGETMGLPWKNGSISTARWYGALLSAVLKDAGIDSETYYTKGYRFLTFYGLEDYHVSIPLKKALDPEGDCMLVWLMNGEPLPRDHGFPLRVMIPGFVGARSVKWISKIIATKTECDGMHQTGIAYKQLAPNQRNLSAVPKQHIVELPPIDQVPVTSAITNPNPGTKVTPGQQLLLQGYGYSGAGLAVIRVDISIDGGENWDQATITRADKTQYSRSGRAWAWVQWQYLVTVPETAKGDLTFYCKAIDDQYNQQPHDSSQIWNIRGILNTSWGNVQVQVGDKEADTHPDAKSGDGTIDNVGVKMDGEFNCPHCRQQYSSEEALNLHYKFIHDPNRHQED